MHQTSKSSGRLFDLRGVGRKYADVEALTPTSLHIAKGERVALVGPSGSGKTTLLRMLNGTVRPTVGTMALLDQDIAGLSPRGLRESRARIATIPQHLGLVDNLRVIQNVACGKIGATGTIRALRSIFFPGSSETADIHALLDRVGIEEKLYARTAQLSGGQKQRVAVARALYQHPEAILADEPVSSVDPARAASLIELICELAEEKDLTLVMSLHNLELARTHFPRLIGLRQGRVAFDGKPSEIVNEEFEALYHLSQDEIVNDE